jgi:hypothetical protein
MQPYKYARFESNNRCDGDQAEWADGCKSSKIYIYIYREREREM